MENRAAKLARALAFAAASLVALQAFVAYAPGTETLRPDHLSSHRLAPEAVQIHALSGGVALLLMALLTFSRHRESWRRYHAALGYAYAAAVVVGATAGLRLAGIADGGLLARSGFAALSGLWILTTVASVSFAITRELPAHQAAARFSMALCFAAVTLRIELPLARLLGFDAETATSIAAWACWLPNLIWAEYRRRHP